MLFLAQWEWINRPSDAVFIVFTGLSILITLFNYIYLITGVKDEYTSFTSYKVQEQQQQHQPQQYMNNESNKYTSKGVNFTSTE